MLLLGALRDGSVATADDLAELLALDLALVAARLADLTVRGLMQPARPQ